MQADRVHDYYVHVITLRLSARVLRTPFPNRWQDSGVCLPTWGRRTLPSQLVERKATAKSITMASSIVWQGRIPYNIRPLEFKGQRQWLRPGVSPEFGHSLISLDSKIH